MNLQNNDQSPSPAYPARQPQDIYPPTPIPPSPNQDPSQTMLNPDVVPVPPANPPAATEDKPQPNNRHLREQLTSILSTLMLFLLAPVIAILISMFVIQSYQVEGRSMETTLQDQDRLIVNKSPRTWSRLTRHPYVPQRGDIIIFNQGGVDPVSSRPKQLIKRVIALPGERVTVKDGKIKVYNKDHPSGFNPDDSDRYKIQATITPGNVDLTIKSNEVFVCGDNRTNSEDSRFFGPVDTADIVGKLALRVLPLDKAKGF